MSKILINGKIVNEKHAKVSVFDRGFQYGDGIFDTMRCYAGKIYMLDEHLSRMYASIKALKIASAIGKLEMKEMIYRCLRANKLKSAYIKVCVTRGEGRFGVGYKDEFRPNIVVVAKEFEGYPAWMHGEGLSAGISKDICVNERSILSKMKTQNFLPYIMSRMLEKGQGYDEAILLNTKGCVAEAATSNIFLVKRSKLTTPSLDSGILPGITRAAVIKIAKRLKISVVEKAVSQKELLAADEVFLTNSLAEVLPVVKINGRRIGSGRPGELTRLLHICYQKEVIRAVTS